MNKNADGFSSKQEYRRFLSQGIAELMASREPARSETFEEIKALFLFLRKSAEKESDLDEETLFRTNRKTTADFVRALDDFRRYIFKNYKDELWGADHYPLKWMLKEKAIRTAITRGNIIRILNYFDKNSLKPKSKESQLLSNKWVYETQINEAGRLIPQKVPYSFILVNEDFYAAAMAELNLSKIYIQKHIQGFKTAGILTHLGKTGENNREQLYADGYFLKWDNKWRKIRFLQDKREFRRCLADLKIK